jgi:hypothetical protein
MRGKATGKPLAEREKTLGRKKPKRVSSVAEV